MGLRIQERGDVIKGTPVVQPGDDLFWFGQPRFLLYLIHFVLFQVFLKYINKLHITVCLWLRQEIEHFLEEKKYRFQAFLKMQF